MSSVMELCVEGEIYGPASAWDGKRESAQKEYMDSWYREIFVNTKDPGWILFFCSGAGR